MTLGHSMYVYSLHFSSRYHLPHHLLLQSSLIILFLCNYFAIVRALLYYVIIVLHMKSICFCFNAKICCCSCICTRVNGSIKSINDHQECIKCSLRMQQVFCCFLQRQLAGDKSLNLQKIKMTDDGYAVVKPASLMVAQRRYSLALITCTFF